MAWICVVPASAHQIASSTEVSVQRTAVQTLLPKGTLKSLQ